MLGKTWACWRCARERGKSGKCICYLYFLQCYKLEKSKKHGETGKQDMRTEAQLKSDFSNTTPRAVRLESSVTWGQISANYVHVKKPPPFSASPSTASALYFIHQHWNIPLSWITYPRPTSSHEIHSNKVLLCFHQSCSKATLPSPVGNHQKYHLEHSMPT